MIVVLSGGGFDAMNPKEVRDRMDRYIADVNGDAFVQANTGGLGLTFKVLPNQKTKHLHQAKWRQICHALSLFDATPLILVGHSNGGAAAMNLPGARRAGQVGRLDLLSGLGTTLDDIGDINKVPPNAHLNINPYIIHPRLAAGAVPIGKRNHRQADNSLDGILNIGLKYNLPGALAHRNAFYELAGVTEGRRRIQAAGVAARRDAGRSRGEATSTSSHSRGVAAGPRHEITDRHRARDDEFHKNLAPRPVERETPSSTLRGTLIRGAFGEEATWRNSRCDRHLHHNAKVDLKQAQEKGGIVGVIQKATQGRAFVDPTYKTNRKKAEAAGVLWGAYHFGTGSDGIAQAEHFLDVAQPTGRTLLVLDLEANPQGPNMPLIEARAFVTHVRQVTGRFPGLYSVTTSGPPGQ